MHTFLLILKIILLVVFAGGMVVSFFAKTHSQRKHFSNKKSVVHAETKFKLICYVVSLSALAVLLILSFFN